MLCFCPEGENWGGGEVEGGVKFTHLRAGLGILCRSSLFYPNIEVHSTIAEKRKPFYYKKTKRFITTITIA